MQKNGYEVNKYPAGNFIQSAVWGRENGSCSFNGLPWQQDEKLPELPEKQGKNGWILFNRYLPEREFLQSGSAVWNK